MTDSKKCQKKCRMRKIDRTLSYTHVSLSINFLKSDNNQLLSHFFLCSYICFYGLLPKILFFFSYWKGWKDKKIKRDFLSCKIFCGWLNFWRYMCSYYVSITFMCETRDKRRIIINFDNENKEKIRIEVVNLILDMYLYSCWQTTAVC